MEGTATLFSQTMLYTTEQRSFLLQHYFEMKSLDAVQPQSLDFTLSDSFLWGYLKKLGAWNELKDRIMA